MIIFDLDCLADDTHRRHWIDPTLHKDYVKTKVWDTFDENNMPLFASTHYVHRETGEPFQPDYERYNAACGDDVPIDPVISIWNDQISLGGMGSHQIWTGRCESQRLLTEKWLDKHLLCFESHQLKMRPVGNTWSSAELKEHWLERMTEDSEYGRLHPIDFVFDSDAESIAMWLRRGIFTFDCRQS